jgi:hypothetical protein
MTTEAAAMTTGGTLLAGPGAPVFRRLALRIGATLVSARFAVASRTQVTRREPGQRPRSRR